jgi:NADH-quinone oxidoreductase subunit A
VPGEYVPQQYLPILIFSVIAAVFGFGQLLIGSLLRPSHAYRDKLLPYESGVQPFSDARIPFPMRYYVIAMLFVIFDIEAVFLYPWAVVFHSIGLYALVEMVLFIAILLVGYVYAWKKGALEWE